LVGVTGTLYHHVSIMTLHQQRRERERERKNAARALCYNLSMRK
jgi:hypothetical protein